MTTRPRHGRPPGNDVAAKAEAEHAPAAGPTAERLRADVDALHAALADARAATRLPDAVAPEAFEALHELVVRARGIR